MDTEIKVRDRSLFTGRGATVQEREGNVKFYPFKIGWWGGGRKLFNNVNIKCINHNGHSHSQFLTFR